MSKTYKGQLPDFVRDGFQDKVDDGIFCGQKITDFSREDLLMILAYTINKYEETFDSYLKHRIGHSK